MRSMTDKEFYTAIGLCYEVEPKYRRCKKYPLLHSDRNCVYVLKDEIRHRLIQSRQDETNGYKQLTLI